MNKQEFLKTLKQEKQFRLQEENLFKYYISFSPQYQAKRDLYSKYLDIHIKLLGIISDELKNNPESTLWLVDFENMEGI